MNFFYKLEVCKENEKQNLNAVVNQFQSFSDKNDIFIKKDVDAQKERLQKRLEKRRINYF